METTIYKIENLINGKCYIGSTVNFSRRKHRHLNTLRHNSHHSIKLQRAFNKYGSENFRIYKLESFMFISKDKTLEREQYYIDLIKPDYNVCKIAGSQYGSLRSDDFKKRCRENMLGKEPWNKGKHSMTEEHKAKMDFGRRHGKKRVMTKKGKESQIMKLSKPVIQYDCNMVFIKEWSSLKDVSKNLPCSYSKISEHVNGKASHKTFKNFIWVLKVYLDQML